VWAEPRQKRRSLIFNTNAIGFTVPPTNFQKPSEDYSTWSCAVFCRSVASWWWSLFPLFVPAWRRVCHSPTHLSFPTCPFSPCFPRSRSYLFFVGLRLDVIPFLVFVWSLCSSSCPVTLWSYSFAFSTLTHISYPLMFFSPARLSLSFI